MMEKVSIKGALIGGIVDVVLSGILAFPLLIYVLVSRGLLRLPKDQIQRALISTIHSSAGLYAMQLLIGFVCTVLGGFIAAKIAKHDHVLNGFLSSLVCVAMGIYSLTAGKSHEPLLVQLALLFVVTPLAGIAGGYLARPRRRATV